MNMQIKFDAVEAYLKKHFLNSVIEQKADFDRGTQTFKVNLPDRTLLLKVSGEFADDNDIEEIYRKFDRLNLAGVLGNEVELAVLVTKRGLEKIHRSA